MQTHSYQAAACLPAVHLQREAALEHRFDFQENLPRILACDARILSFETLGEDSRHSLSGMAEMILYTSSSGILSTHKARLPFQVDLSYDVPLFGVQAVCSCTQVRLRRQDDASYRAQCSVQVTASGFPQQEMTLVHSISDPVPESRIDTSEVLVREVCAHHDLMVEEDAVLEPQLLEIGDILDLGGHVLFCECQSNAGEAHITGTLEADLLYRAKDSDTIVHTKLPIPFQDRLHRADFSEGASPEVHIRGCDVTGRIYPDVEGRDKLLHISARIPLTLLEDQSETLTHMEDAFYPDRELILDRKPERISCVPLRSRITQPVRLQFSGEGESPAEVLHALYRLETDSLHCTQDHCRLESNLSVSILFRDRAGTLRTEVFNTSLETQCSISCPQLTLFPQDYQLLCTPAHDGFALTGEVQWSLTQYPMLDISPVTDAREGEPYPKEDWSLKLIAAEEGDTLFSLAKRSRVSLRDLRACNPDAEDTPLRAAQMLTVIR